MNFLNVGSAILVNKYMGFLVYDYHMNNCFQELPNTEGAQNPTYIFSYYNQSGCFSFVEVPQRGEWDCYYAEKFSNDPYMLLKTRINQRNYIHKNIFTAKSFLKHTAQIIKQQIVSSKSFFGISV